MVPRVELTITPLDALWRVCATIDGRRAPQYLRQFPTHLEAIAYAETLGNVLALARFRVRIRDEGMA